MTGFPKFALNPLTRRFLTSLAVVGLLFLTAVPLQAHHLPPGMEDVDEFEDGAAFMAGLQHPLLGLDHWMFAVAIGALAGVFARAGSSGGWQVSLLLGVLMGAMLGLKGMVLPGLHFSSVLALLVPLMVVMLRQHLPGLALSSLVALAAFWQGNQHGVAWPLEATSGFYLAGMMVMTALLSQSGGAMVWAARHVLAMRRSSTSVSSF